MAEITIAELVRNGTMSARMAALLWAAVDQQLSFLTVAVPQLAGKTTTSQAVLALRPPEVPLHHVAGDHNQLERLKRERLGGYLVVGEFSRAPVPGYIWGEPIRRVFDTLTAGYSLQTSLHAPGVEEAVHAVTLGNGVSDEHASLIKLVLYIERFGGSRRDFWRRLTEVYEIDRVEGGRPAGRTLFRWRREDDSFQQVNDPRQFAQDEEDLRLRASIMEELAGSGRTGHEDVAAAVAAYRSGFRSPASWSTPGSQA